MAIPFLNNINLSDNQLLNAKLQVTGTAPTAAAGQIYFNSTENVAKYHNGTAWVDISRKISVGGTPLAYSQAINLVAGTNVGIAEASGVITISSTDQFQGTVTSVSSSTAGDALDVAVTNATTTPDLAFTWAGNPASYVRGDGTLATFPTIPTVPSNIVETVVTTNGTFIDLTPTTAASGDVTITADLSAGGTPSDTTYLRGDNSWEPISGIPGTYEFTLSDNASPTPVTGTVAEDDTVQIAANADLTSNLTGQATTSKLLTLGLKVDGGVGISDNYVVNQATAVAKAVDTIPFNDYTENVNPALNTNIVKKTTFGTIPVSALTLVKQYIDDSVAGGLVYQGGYDANLNSPDLTTSPNSIEKGWTYTVTVGGTFFGEVLEVGDVLIAEQDDPSSLADWTTVQNNIGIATDGTDTGAGAAIIGISRYDEDDFTVSATGFVQLNATSATGTITAGSTSGTVIHNFGTTNVIVQTYLDNATDNYPTVFCDITRTTTEVTATIAATETDNIIILVQKIG